MAKTKSKFCDYIGCNEPSSETSTPSYCTSHRNTFEDYMNRGKISDAMKIVANTKQK